MAKGLIPVTWISLNSQSKLNLFNIPDLLTRIKMVVNQENVHTYAVIRSTNYTNNHPLLKLDKLFDPYGKANIVLLSIVTKHYPVAF